MRNLLNTVGIDLSSQVTNQDLARLGSKTGLVSTVDMTSASDTVALTAVEWYYSLVPDVWAYLDRTRARMGWLAGERVIYRKLSSMGNATTFEVETSLFWALAESVCDILKADKRFLAVYGDDVVLPTKCVPLFLDVLKESGFLPNPKKTFWETTDSSHAFRFRESCGSHFLNGEDVTPVYIKSQPQGLLDYFHLVNNTVRWLKRLELLSDAPDLSEAWRYIRELREHAPRKWRKPRIPDGYGDGAFIGTFDECTPRVAASKKRLYAEGYRIEVLTERFDTTNSIDDRGVPIVKSTDWKVRKSYPPLVARENARVVKGVTLEGFLLSRLEQLERRGTPWHQVTQRFTNQTAARLIGTLESEGASIELPSTRQVCTSVLWLRPGIDW